jgi:HD superfamily phosphohydrolase
LKVQAKDVAKLALGPKKFGPRKHRQESFDEWEAILAEIIVGDAFGADRMDYLLRDSYHAGVAYGRFDHYRLIDTLRILSKPRPEDGGQDTPGSGTSEPTAPRAAGPAPARPGEEVRGERAETTLGVTEGGLHSAEALLLARYFMYTQLYFHPVRRIYDIHLKEFLKRWLPGGAFSTKIEDHLNLTDNEVMAAILAAARDRTHPAHDPARRIVERDHYRKVYQRNPDDVAVNPEAAQAVATNLAMNFKGTNVYYDVYKERSRPLNFPVLTPDGRVVSSLALSETLRHLPVVAVDFVFVAPEHRQEAEQWLQGNPKSAIQRKDEET